jgi:hypothetical protein
MAASPAARPHPAAHADPAGAVLLVVGLTLLPAGLLAFFAPGAFYDTIAGYPPENSHVLRDIGSFQVALAAAALAAWRRPAFRTPVLGLLALQFALHTVSHVIDVGESDPAWQGPVTLAALTLGTVLLIAVFVKELRQ